MVIDVERQTLEREIVGQLRGAGVWDPVGDAKALLDRYLGPVNLEAAITQLEYAVRERCERLPLEHIVGSATVDGSSFVVGTGAFIPRTASQRIIELAADSSALPVKGTVLDLCAGVGTIGIGIALRRHDARICMVELGSVPFGYLRRNMSRLLAPGTALVEAQQSDLFELDFADVTPMDVVVANPPYMPPHLSLPPEWRDHQPAEAVYGGLDGLHVVRRVVEIAAAVLRPGTGTLLIEHDRSQPATIRALLEAGPFAEVETFLDSSNETRITRARRISE